MKTRDYAPTVDSPKRVFVEETLTSPTDVKESQTFYSKDKPYPVACMLERENDFYIPQIIGTSVQQGIDVLVDREMRSWTFRHPVPAGRRVKLSYDFEVIEHQHINEDNISKLNLATMISGRFWAISKHLENIEKKLGIDNDMWRVIDGQQEVSDIQHMAIEADLTDYHNGNASHRYNIGPRVSGDWINGKKNFAEIKFQQGPTQYTGVNGIQDADLLRVLIDRLEGFQSGPYADDDNAVTLSFLQSALASYNARTEKRKARGVEGTSTI